MFTNGILLHRASERPPDLLRTGAASFKRLLGCAPQVIARVPFPSGSTGSTHRDCPGTAILMPDGPVLGTHQCRRAPHATGLSLGLALLVSNRTGLTDAGRGDEADHAGFHTRIAFGGGDAQPNGSRLSCGALRRIHSIIYARRQLQALVRQLQGTETPLRRSPQCGPARTKSSPEETSARRGDAKSDRAGAEASPPARVRRRSDGARRAPPPNTVSETHPDGLLLRHPWPPRSVGRPHMRRAPRPQPPRAPSGPRGKAVTPTSLERTTSGCRATRRRTWASGSWASSHRANASEGSSSANSGKDATPATSSSIRERRSAACRWNWLSWYSATSIGMSG